MIVALLLELILTDICQNLAAKVMTIVKLKHLQEFFILFKFKLTVSVYLQLFILSIGLIYVFTKIIIFLYKKIKKSIKLLFFFFKYIQNVKIDLYHYSFTEIMIQIFFNFIQLIKKLITKFILNIYILEYYIMVVLGTIFIIFLFIYILYLIYKY